MKAEIRRTALARRRALPPAERAWRSEQLVAQLFRHFPVAEWGWLHLFLPLVPRGEPDTWLIIHRIWAAKLPVRLAVPVVQADGASLRHYELRPETRLLTTRWGIPEPDVSLATEVSPTILDVVLVPLLAVDVNGQRVGYGGGFYDRFLAQCRPGAQFIGLSLLDDEPVAPLPDVLPTDVPLHACVSPAGVRYFR